MGYATIQQVQRIDEADHYAQAHRIWDTTKPIRGGDRNARPLGARRDAREYYCTKDPLTGNITYHYYSKPAISFAPNGDVVICPHDWCVGIRQLIHRVLGIPAYMKNGSVILEVGGIKKVINLKAGVRLVKKDGNWQTTDEPKLYGYKINRKKMTEVKAEYKEFERFFKGFLAVQKMDKPIVHKYETSFKCIPIHVSTMIELFGAVKDSHQRSYVNITKYREMVDKPHVHTRYVATHAGLHYFNASGAVAELITSNQSEDTKQANFLKGAYLFCYRAASYGFYMETDDGTKYAHLNKTLKIYEDFILLKHTDSVTDLVELPDGTLPNPKLAKAMTWHEQSDECEKLRKARETQTEYDPTQNQD